MNLQRKKDEYQYVYKKDVDLKDDTITSEKKGNVEYGNDFIT